MSTLRIEHALAIARQRTSPAVIQVGHKLPTTLEVINKCSVYDKPYKVTLALRPNGLYGFVRSEQMGELRTGANGNSDLFELDPSRLDKQSPSSYCAWCNCGPKRVGRQGLLASTIQCGKCGWYVCPGRTNGEVFMCGASCGQVGNMSDEYVNVRASALDERAPGTLKSSVSRKNYLMLGSGR